MKAQPRKPKQETFQDEMPLEINSGDLSPDSQLNEINHLYGEQSILCYLYKLKDGKKVRLTKFDYIPEPITDIQAKYGGGDYVLYFHKINEAGKYESLKQVSITLAGSDKLEPAATGSNASNDFVNNLIQFKQLGLLKQEDTKGFEKIVEMITAQNQQTMQLVIALLQNQNKSSESPYMENMLNTLLQTSLKKNDSFEDLMKLMEMKEILNANNDKSDFWSEAGKVLPALMQQQQMPMPQQIPQQQRKNKQQNLKEIIREVIREELSNFETISEEETQPQEETLPETEQPEIDNSIQQTMNPLSSLVRNMNETQKVEMLKQYLSEYTPLEVKQYCLDNMFVNSEHEFHYLYQKATGETFPIPTEN